MMSRAESNRKLESPINVENFENFMHLLRLEAERICKRLDTDQMENSDQVDNGISDEILDDALLDQSIIINGVSILSSSSSNCSLSPFTAVNTNNDNLTPPPEILATTSNSTPLPATLPLESTPSITKEAEIFRKEKMINENIITEQSVADDNDVDEDELFKRKDESQSENTFTELTSDLMSFEGDIAKLEIDQDEESGYLSYSYQSKQSSIILPKKSNLSTITEENDPIAKKELLVNCLNDLSNKEQDEQSPEDNSKVGESGYLTSRPMNLPEETINYKSNKNTNITTATVINDLNESHLEIIIYFYLLLPLLIIILEFNYFYL